MTKWKVWRAVSMLLFLSESAFIGFLDYVYYESIRWTSMSTFLDIVVATASIAFWCHFDAKIRDYQISMRHRVWIVLVSLIAVPVYIVKSRGWPGAWKLGLGIPLFAVSIWSHDLGWSIASRVVGPGITITQNQEPNQPPETRPTCRPVSA